jgi:hypothetical protein
MEDRRVGENQEEWLGEEDPGDPSDLAHAWLSQRLLALSHFITREVAHGRAR